MPGALAWTTLILMVFLSWKLPTAVSVFIILFDIYWLLKTIYLSFHLRSTFLQMRKNMKVNWLEKLRRENIGGYGDVYHLVVLPMHNEPYELVRESLESLVAANYPKDKLLVVLAIEERAGESAKRVAELIKKDFDKKFFRLLVTNHPVGLAGEIPGKGANETWAARRALEEVVDPLGLDSEKILVSVFDVDTQIFPEYFGCLTHSFLTAAEPLRAIYQPIPFFTNNIYRAPALARVVAFSTTFWQMMQQSRPERLTSFSSQSIPLQTLIEIGFWHTNIVSEDSRIFWQCYLHYHGNFRVEPMYYPVSMDANVAPSLWGTLKNIYRQQRRWGWGAENIPYMLDGFAKDKQIPRRKKWYWSFNVIEGFHSWATNSLIIFALGWLPVMLGGRNFNYTLLSYNLPQITRFIITLSMIGIASSAVLGILLLPPRPQWFKKRHYLIYFFQWLLIPITLIIFGAFPGLEAQTRLALGGRFRLGFWVTPKMRQARVQENQGR
ncbi:glycosyltransferase family 2 protein [Patescibacteria group bacterium]|nr:glycosyltransferase family 2 protein [Patescibacteria group bacterium]